MRPSISTHSPRARLLTHPGPFSPIRIQSSSAAAAKHVRLSLAPGQSLFDALVAPLAQMGISSASTTILGGHFAELAFCVAPPDPSKKAVIAYTTPTQAGSTYMVFGNATVGKGVNGAPLVHCHAVIHTSDGTVKGGHIIAQGSIVGATPISVLVTAFEGFELRATFDPETNIPLMQPHRTLRNV